MAEFDTKPLDALLFVCIFAPHLLGGVKWCACVVW